MKKLNPVTLAYEKLIAEEKRLFADVERTCAVVRTAKIKTVAILMERDKAWENWCAFFDTHYVTRG